MVTRASTDRLTGLKSNVTSAGSMVMDGGDARLATVARAQVQEAQEQQQAQEQ